MHWANLFIHLLHCKSRTQNNQFATELLGANIAACFQAPGISAVESHNNLHVLDGHRGRKRADVGVEKCA